MPFMEALLQSSSSSVYLLSDVPKIMINNGIRVNYNPCLISANGYSSSSSCPFSSPKLTVGPRKSGSVIVRAKKEDKKEDKHSSNPKPDEATWFFPEAVLLKENKVEENGKLLPEFADAEEKQLFESLMLELESDLNLEQMRHYEVVYLIHEKHAEEVGNVNEKVQDFLKEKKGRLYRLNDWGMRRLAYKIKKAKNAHYMLMNFELDAKYINEFKSLLDKDERVIRHLVIKMDEAVTKDCPPPPEFHTLRGDMDDYDEDDEGEYSDEDDEGEYSDEDYDDDWDGEDEMDGNDDEGEDGIIVVDADEDGNDNEYENDKLDNVKQPEVRNLRTEKVVR